MCWSPVCRMMYSLSNTLIDISEKLKVKDGCGTQIYSRGALLGILYGAYGPVLQILTLFQTK